MLYRVHVVPELLKSSTTASSTEDQKNAMPTAQNKASIEISYRTIPG